MRHSKRRFAFLAVLAVSAWLTVGVQTAAAETKGWDAGKDVRPTVDDLIPSLASSEAYSERYSMSAKLDGGGNIKFDFTISNLGWGNHSAEAAVKVKSPDHKNYKFKKKVDKGNWSHSKDKFKLDIAKTSVESLEGGGFEYRHDGDVKVRLKMTSKVPMWSPGDGKISVDGGFYKMNVYGLRATLEGKVKVGGEWREVKSTRGGYADHVATNVAPFNLASRFSRTRVYDDDNDVFFLWREVRLSSKYGGDSLNWLVVGYKDEIVFSDADVNTKFGKMRKDKAGYEIPYAVQIEGKQGEDEVKLVLRGEDMRRKDLLEDYGRVAKMVASSVSTPYNYYFDCKYALEMDIGGAKATVRGSGGYVIDYLNKE